MAISIKGLGKDHLGEKDSRKEKEEDLEGSIKGRDISDVFDISLTEVWKMGT